MESTCEVGKVNVSATTYESVKDHPGLSFTARGEIEVKGKGKMPMWYVAKKSA
jgi:adenylate cyclase